MNFSGSSGSSGDQRSPATALRIQTSLQGQPRPFGWGQARISGNLIEYSNFIADYVPGSSGGGKGGGNASGGKGGTAGGEYLYYACVAIGLCEGPIDSVLQAWSNKSAVLPNSGSADLGYALFDGSYSQIPSPALATLDPSAAIAFRGLAYEMNGNLSLGTSAELPNMTWEVRFAISGGIVENGTVPGSPYKLTAAYFDYDNGVTTRFTIPYASPYEYSVVDGALVAPQSAIAAALSIYDSVWAASNSSGIVWDVGATNGTPGQPLTRVSGTPSTGQYKVTGSTGVGFTWYFAAADAGQPVVGINASLSPGVYYAASTTATISAGSMEVTGIAALAGIAVGSRTQGGSGVPPGATVTAIAGGSATGTTANGSPTVSAVAGSFSAPAGATVTDAGGAVPAATTVLSATSASLTAATPSALTIAGAALVLSTSSAGIIGTLNDNEITGLASTAAIAIGDTVIDSYEYLSLGSGVTVTGISGTTVTLSVHTNFSAGGDLFFFYATIVGDLTAGSPTIANLRSLAGASTSKFITSIGEGGTGAAFPEYTAISAVTPGSITLSANATASLTADQLNFGNLLTLSAPASASGTVPIVFRGAPLQQVLSSPSQGEFSLSVQAGAFGQYTFAAADDGATILIMDSPDANPADVVYDFLTNPYYGMTQFPASRIGNLSTYRTYCQASGLLVSPTITTQGAANQFLQDLMTATNSEMVWSGGLLTIVPYGDTALTANGATFTPDLTPIYSLDDDDILSANQGSNPKSAASFASDDPVQVTRLDIIDQDNDIKLEYLDRANAYNPAIVEAQDDAAIALFGLKNSGSKQMHIFCDETAAINSAQLMLGRTQVLRTFSFTVGREFILLDPMDIIEITDVNAGLVNQAIRITEITENDDRSLSITAEEVLEGTGSTPLYGHQSGQGYVPNYNTAAPSALAPIFFDAPVQLGNVLGMETLLATNGSGSNWGGCDIWLASDNVNFKYAGTLWGGTAMGALTASFASGSDPDTVNTLAVDLTESHGALSGGTQADADDGNTLCLVDSELVTYEQATLTAQYKYNLGVSGGNPGYLRRGVYGTTIASHSSGAPFARLRPGSYFTIGYGAGDVGNTIYVKLLSFNPYGGGKQTLDQVSSYSHSLAAPPVVSTGLLAGLIQTPDIALNAATAQLTVSAVGPTSLPVSPANATLVSGTLTTAGNLVQIAYNAQFTNSGTSAETAVWRVTYQGVTVLDSASITIQPGVTATIAKQTTFSAPNQSGVFAMIAQGQTAADANLVASFMDLSATEIRR